MKILTMIEAGKISAAEGAELLKALSQPADNSVQDTLPRSKKPRRFRLVITDKDGERKVNVNLPMGLVKVGMKMGARFAPYSDDRTDIELLETVKKAVASGQTGKITEISSEAGERIEIFVE